jgi:hypothetical protein
MARLPRVPLRVCFCAAPSTEQTLRLREYRVDVERDPARPGQPSVSRLLKAGRRADHSRTPYVQPHLHREMPDLGLGPPSDLLANPRPRRAEGKAHSPDIPVLGRIPVDRVLAQSAAPAARPGTPGTPAAALTNRTGHQTGPRSPPAGPAPQDTAGVASPLTPPQVMPLLPGIPRTRSEVNKLPLVQEAVLHHPHLGESELLGFLRIAGRHSVVPGHRFSAGPVQVRASFASAPGAGNDQLSRTSVVHASPQPRARIRGRGPRQAQKQVAMASIIRHRGRAGRPCARAGILRCWPHHKVGQVNFRLPAVTR